MKKIRIHEPKNGVYVLIEVHKMDIDFVKSLITLCGYDIPPVYTYISIKFIKQ